MQHKYVGDIGDFGKYALLNHLQAESGLSLGVVWYLTNPEHTDAEHQAKDGKHIRYLGLDMTDNGTIIEVCPTQDGISLQKLDNKLYSKLKKIIQNDRSIYSIEREQIVNEGAIFFSEELSLGRKLNPRKRKQARETWLNRAMQKIEQAGIVFLDPDNGLAKAGRTGTRFTDAKYVLHEDLKCFWGDGTRTLVLYHHPDRSRDHDSQIADCTKEIEKMLTGSSVYPIRYRHGTSRVYFVIVPESAGKLWSGYLGDFSDLEWPVSEKSSTDFEF